MVFDSVGQDNGGVELGEFAVVCEETMLSRRNFIAQGNVVEEFVVR